MKKTDDSGQMILIACVLAAIAILLITVYEYSALGTGEQSINRENADSFYYYGKIRALYADIYKDPKNLNFSDSYNITLYEKELKQFAILHGYSVNFRRENGITNLTFADGNLKIQEEFR